MGDIFLLFASKQHIKMFFRYINSRHKNMSFTVEEEFEDKLPFLDILVIRGEKFITNIYRKPTFSGLYSNFYSFLPEKYKIGLIHTLLFRIYTICSDRSNIFIEIGKLRKFMRKNEYPSNFLDKHVKLFFDKVFSKKTSMDNYDVPRKVVKINLPFMGTDSLRLRTKLTNIVRNYFPMCKVQISLNAGCRLGNFFRFKDKVPLNVRSLILYKFSCGGCNSIYLGKSKRHYLVRVFEHLGISLATGKRYSYNSKNNNNTAVLNHINNDTCNAALDNFRIIGSARNDYSLCLKESLLIQLHKYNLNNNVKSMPLKLFD